MSQRLIKVLGEEADLRDSAQADTKTPFIKDNFFREIFESNRGNVLKSYGVEMIPSDNDEDNYDSK